MARYSPEYPFTPTQSAGKEWSIAARPEARPHNIQSRARASHDDDDCLRAMTEKESNQVRKPHEP